MRPWNNHASKGGGDGSFLFCHGGQCSDCWMLGVVPPPPPPPPSLSMSVWPHLLPSKRLLDRSRPSLLLACGCLRGSWGLGEKARGPGERGPAFDGTGGGNE